MPIKLLTIDLDDTLWPCRPVIDRAEAALFEWLAREAEAVTAVHDTASLREHRRALMAERPDIAHDLTTLREQSLRQLLAEFGYAPDLAGPAMAIFLAERNRVDPYADVIPALRALRQRYCLISLTNGNADVTQTPLRDCFDYSLTAADVGAAKPAPAQFARAMQLAGADPDTSVHIGDDPELDVHAARTLGLRTVWINRAQRRWPDELTPPDVSFADLSALDKWLATLHHS